MGVVEDQISDRLVVEEGEGKIPRITLGKKARVAASKCPIAGKESSNSIIDFPAARKCYVPVEALPRTFACAVTHPRVRTFSFKLKMHKVLEIFPPP